MGRRPGRFGAWLQMGVLGGAGDDERERSVGKYAWRVGASCAPKGAGATVFDFNFGLRPKFFWVTTVWEEVQEESFYVLNEVGGWGAADRAADLIICGDVSCEKSLFG